jgi:hypothetical protein
MHISSLQLCELDVSPSILHSISSSISGIGFKSVARNSPTPQLATKDPTAESRSWEGPFQEQQSQLYARAPGNKVDPMMALRYE